MMRVGVWRRHHIKEATKAGMHADISTSNKLTKVVIPVERYSEADPI